MSEPRLLAPKATFEVATDFGVTPLCLLMMYINDRFVIFMSGEVPCDTNMEPFCRRLVEPALLDDWEEAIANSTLAEVGNWFKKYLMWSLIPWSIQLDDSVLQGSFGTPVFVTASAERLIYSQAYPITSSGSAHMIPDHRYNGSGHSASPGTSIHHDYLIGKNPDTCFVRVEYADRDPNGWDQTVVYLSHSGKYHADSQQVSLWTAEGNAFIPITRESLLNGKALPWVGAKLGTDKGLNVRLASWITSYYATHDRYPWVLERSRRASAEKKAKGALDATAMTLMDLEPTRRCATLRRQSFAAGVALAYAPELFDKKYKSILERYMVLHPAERSTARNVSAITKAAADVVSAAKEAIENGMEPVIPVVCDIQRGHHGMHAPMGYTLPVDISSADNFYKGEFVHTQERDHFYDLRLTKSAGGQGARNWHFSGQETEQSGSFAHKTALYPTFLSMDRAVMCTPDFIYGFEMQGSSAYNLSDHYYCQFVGLPYLIRMRSPQSQKLLPPYKSWSHLSGVWVLGLYNAGAPKANVNDRDVGKKIFSTQEVYL